MKIARAFVWLALAFAALACGCASIPMADQTADMNAKRFSVSPGKAKIYVFRNETFGAAITMTVNLDDRLLGQTASRTYLVAEVDPGRHRVTGKAENETWVDIIAVAGRIYYIWQEVKMGLMSARNELREVDEKTGRAGVMESNLAK